MPRSTWMAVDAQFTWIVYKPGEARDFPVLLHGNVATPGEIVPRHFPAVLAKGDSLLKNGSGRLELAERIFTDAAPLAARVIVNRVWGWHFGRPLVATPSDFGVQGEKPTHPELLDDLAARFIAHGWSLKWLNREIMLSAAYRQSSRPRADAEKVDQVNTLLWRMNPRRLDVESYRDTLLRSAGPLERQDVRPLRRCRVRDQRSPHGLRAREPRTPQQSAEGVRFSRSDADQRRPRPDHHFAAAALHHEQPVHACRGGGARPRPSAASPTTRRRCARCTARCCRATQARKSSIWRSSYLTQGTMEQYAQVLLSTNEEIFWP